MKQRECPQQLSLPIQLFKGSFRIL